MKAIKISKDAVCMPKHQFGDLVYIRTYLNKLVMRLKDVPFCVTEASHRREPLIPLKLPDYPWQKVGTNLFYLKKSLIICYFSRFIKATKLTIIEALQSCWGKPERAPHKREVRAVGLSVCLSVCLSLCLSFCLYVHDTKIYKSNINLRGTFSC